MKKILILIFITIISSGLVYALAYYIRMDSFSFALALNFMLMACVLTFTEVMKSGLNSPYFNEKTWEKKGQIYESLGIHFFRKLLVVTGWEKLNKKSKPVQKNPEALVNLYYRTKQDELGHLIIMIIVLGFNIFVAYKFGILKSMWLLILNILLNIYPIFLQRYNRPRIERIMHFIGRR
ncbi:glycosyl-4,4'-diaponeurosporenoate acyltransferase CrtO family protein [Chryseobacterium lathyri]|uniref:glycosyl-4,4'-diaponeurosporenoate acyltransferase CrtO family protein n=1 Tax=Chryseobacterium lathyri TaxID=395933 RepID=UPI00278375ED|nr:hypothetical protein [Chryseobacterium lathyri]MDQ0067627.1 hypothetical protein [Chryseobacterium lathyri]